MLFHVLLDSVLGEGAIPMYMDAHERLEWVTHRKAWATELLQRKLYLRAMRHYKKAMLDLEVPCEWYKEEHVVERNQAEHDTHRHDRSRDGIADSGEPRREAGRSTGDES